MKLVDTVKFDAPVSSMYGCVKKLPNERSVKRPELVLQCKNSDTRFPDKYRLRRQPK